MTEPFEIPSGTELASLVSRAEAAFERADVRSIDQMYQRAAVVADTDESRSALAADHVGRLLALGGISLARQRCEQYLANGRAKDTGLLLLQAEAHGAAGDHGAAVAWAESMREVQRTRSAPLSGTDQGRLLRVDGLAAADQDNLARAVQLLTQARQSFLEAGAPGHVAVIDADLLLIRVRRGDKEAVAAALSRPDPVTTADRLLVATALKRELRYEEAYRLLRLAHSAPDLDPAHRLPVLGQLIVLAWLTAQDEEAERLLEQLRETTAPSRDTSVAELLVRLDPGALPAMEPWPVTTASFTQVTQRARRVINADPPDRDQLRSAESLLTRLRSAAETDREEAIWHLAAGELGLKRLPSRCPADSPVLGSTIAHFEHALKLAKADDDAMLETRILALRRLGRAHARPRDGGGWRAAGYWEEAHRLDEEKARRQKTDAIRIGMLLEAADGHDERITAVAEVMTVRGRHTIAGIAAAGVAVAEIAVAMEAARGATILHAILPAESGPVRQLPGLGDSDGAWRWILGITHSMPRDQAAWLLHATPDHVHHAIIRRGSCGPELCYLPVPVSRRKLEDAMDKLTSCWDPKVLEPSVRSGEFDKALAAIAQLIGVGEIVRSMPEGVRRVATVAGWALADIPFAALPVPRSSAPLGHRYAFSDLPCLSARLPLHLRSRRQRGDSTLLVSPPGDGLTASSLKRGPLLDDDATPQRLRAKAESRRYSRVRIDAHGRYDRDDPARSWLQLAPDGSLGRLIPDLLQGMDLRGCGTLIVGACESGMAHRKGRDERAGFVRAGIHAGAAAVLAARWIADDPVAAAVLDRFERYLRCLPRDLALRQAQLDVCDGKTDLPATLGDLSHPARWACWTLYGDSGWQTRVGPLRRRLNQRRNLV